MNLFSSDNFSSILKEIIKLELSFDKEIHANNLPYFCYERRLSKSTDMRNYNYY